MTIILWQFEGLNKENRCFCAGDIRARAVVPAAAAGCHAVGCQLFNEVCAEGAGRDISEDAGRCGRHKRNAVRGADQEDRHFGASDQSARAVVSAAAAAGNSISSQLFDEVSAEGADRGIGEDAGRCGRHKSRSVLGAHQQDRHLVARNISRTFAWRHEMIRCGDDNQAAVR